MTTLLADKQPWDKNTRVYYADPHGQDEEYYVPCVGYIRSFLPHEVHEMHGEKYLKSYTAVIALESCYGTKESLIKTSLERSLAWHKEQADAIERQLNPAIKPFIQQ